MEQNSRIAKVTEALPKWDAFRLHNPLLSSLSPADVGLFRVLILLGQQILTRWAFNSHNQKICFLKILHSQLHLICLVLGHPFMTFRTADEALFQALIFLSKQIVTQQIHNNMCKLHTCMDIVYSLIVLESQGSPLMSGCFHEMIPENDGKSLYELHNALLRAFYHLPLKYVCCLRSYSSAG